MAEGCSICEHEAVHHEWPLRNADGSRWNAFQTHCNECHRTWAAKAEAHCMTCHQHFTSDSVADRHEPWCSPDPERTHEALASSLRSDGRPRFELLERKSGPTWLRGRSHEHGMAE